MQRKDLGDGGWENIGQGTGREGSNRYEEDSIGTVASIVRRLRDAKKCIFEPLFKISSRHHFADVQLPAETD